MSTTMELYYVRTLFRHDELAAFFSIENCHLMPTWHKAVAIFVACHILKVALAIDIGECWTRMRIPNRGLIKAQKLQPHRFF